MILLISNRNDLTTDFVVREILRRDLPFARLNTDEFPTQAHGSVSFENKTSTYLLKWKNRNKILDFRNITSVLYRRPVPPVPHTSLEDPGLIKFCIDESYDFLRGIWFSLECHWISYPEAIRKAEHKIYQLSVAKNLGFNIPKTLITNDPIEARDFFYKCDNGMIIKPLYLGFIDSSEGPKNIYTSVVTEDDLESIETIELAPSILQERIHKLFDLRVTIIGDEIFTAKIEADSFPTHIPDWRYLPIQELQHTIYGLPFDIETICIELVQKLDLEFGAVDLAVDESGEYVFFEINPNGQWAWLETIMGFPISKKIVDNLTNKAI
jgi:glutathione synthase/RimK-type ligase-like ATP-grasp enzyme